MILKAWLIEEVDLGDGNVGQRQTVAEFDSETGLWVRPDERLQDQDAINEWDDVMHKMENLQGEDLRYCMSPVGLMDHCNDKSLGRENRKRGNKGD